MGNLGHTPATNLKYYIYCNCKEPNCKQSENKTLFLSEGEKPIGELIPYEWESYDINLQEKYGLSLYEYINTYCNEKTFITKITYQTYYDETIVYEISYNLLGNDTWVKQSKEPIYRGQSDNQLKEIISKIPNSLFLLFFIIFYIILKALEYLLTHFTIVKKNNP